MFNQIHLGLELERFVGWRWISAPQIGHNVWGRASSEAVRCVCAYMPATPEPECALFSHAHAGGAREGFQPILFCFFCQLLLTSWKSFRTTQHGAIEPCGVSS